MLGRDGRELSQNGTERFRLMRLNAAEHDVRELQQKLESVEKHLHCFCSDHMRILGTQRMIVAPSVDARAALDRAWHELIGKRDRLLTQFHAALKLYAEVKSEQGG